AYREALVKALVGHSGLSIFFFFQAEDGIRDGHVTGVQTCALPISFANVAVDLIREGVHGRLTAVRDGKYAHVPIPDPKLGARRIDVPNMYNLTRYRPHYAGRIGSPLLLSTADGIYA